LIHELTGSTLWAGLTTTASLGPVLLFSLWGGVVADKTNRLVLVRATRALFAVLALITALLIMTKLVEPWHILIISLATGFLLAFDIPSRAAMLPALVPKEYLPNAIALYSLVFGAAGMLGPAVFAPLVAIWGIAGVFWVITIAYLLTVTVLFGMNGQQHQARDRSSPILQSLFRGLFYAYRHRMILGTVVMGIIMGIFGSSFEALLPMFSDQVLDGDIKAYSRLLLSEGTGALITMIIIGVFGIRIQATKCYIVSGIGFGLALVLLAQSTHLNAALISIAVVGASRVVFQTMATTLMQTLTNNKFRGRVMSLGQLTWGASAIGGFMMGLGGKYAGTRTTMTLGGAIVTAASILIQFGFFQTDPR